MPLLTPHEARELTFRASGIFERHAMLQGHDGFADGDASQDRLAALMKTWLHAFSLGDAAALERRLEWDSLSLDALRRVVAEPHLVASAIDIDPWTAWLTDVLETAPAVAREVIADPGHIAERRLFVGAVEPPFLEIFTAWVRAARRRLTADSAAWRAAAPAVLDALETQLFQELSGVSELALYDRCRHWLQSTGRSAGTGRGARDGYVAFVIDQLRGGMIAFWTAYPVLARQLATVVQAWVTATSELLERAQTDHDDLTRMFGALGTVSRVQPGLSDPHNGRRRVALVTFESGTALAYKPRDVSLEAGLSAFLAWANNAGLDPVQPHLRVLGRAGHGWCEVAVQARFTAAGQVETYYRTAGGLLALCYVLRGRDLQMENVVATSAGPAIIDAEMLCQPSRDIELDAAGRLLPESCLASGLLTMAHVGPADVVFDIGGLRGDGVTPTSRGRRRWEQLGTDDLAFSEERVVTQPTANRVLLDGDLQDPSAHRGALLDGFRSAYRFLLAQRTALLSAAGPLVVFAGCATRVLFRPSQHYGSVQYALAAPAYQTSGVLRSCAIDTLNRIFNLDTGRPPLWPVAEDERRALDALDLPRYWVGVDSIRVEGPRGELDVPYFSRSGLDGVRAVVQSLSDDDLTRQCAILEVALSAGVGVRLLTPLGGRPDDRHSTAGWLIEHAEALAAEIHGRARREDGALRWSAHDSKPDQWSRHVLYDGTLGTAVFFAGLARATGRTRYLDDARDAAADLMALIDADAPSAVGQVGIGGCTGVGSMVYGLCVLQALTGHTRYGAAAARLAGTLVPESADRDEIFDVTGGSAGAVLGLLTLHDLNGDATWLPLTQAFGDRLVQTQQVQPAGAAWPVRRGRPIAGFAHGSAGIALALSRLAEASGDVRYVEAARAAMAHERSLLVPSLGNWPVIGALDPATGSGHSIMTAWCHGAAGIGLSRALLPLGLRDAAWADDIGTAMATTAGAPLGALDQVCCGNLGRADILITIGTSLDRSDLVTMGVSLAGQAADRASRRQLYGLRASGVDYRVFDPGLFRGLAGIGYALLRAARVVEVPSLLAFDMPRRRTQLRPEESRHESA